MNDSPGDRYASRSLFRRFGVFLPIFLGGAAFLLSPAPAPAQPVDCGQLAAQINALGDAGQRRSTHYGSGAQKQRAELDRTITYARSLGCNRQQLFFLDPAAAQCPGLNAKIQQMQSSLGQAQGGGDPAGNPALKQQLTERYNAYCRGQVQASPQPPRQRNFFEALFGVFVPNQNQNPFAQQPNEEIRHDPNEDLAPHGGSQAVCVRECDGGFFPLNISARQGDPEQLTDLCQALCPNTSVRVFTRSPNSEIATAVSLNGDTPYSELPNALKFQKRFDPACTCKPPGQSWAEALLGAERVLGGRERERKTDITVTPESSVELSRPKLDKTTQRKLGNQASPAPQDQAGDDAANAAGQAETQEITGPDGVKRRVRIIVPPL